ncbi:MAG: hypothetical protein ACOY90_20465 [Candidatus Zhuqueibacterota bacterium]
MAVKRIFLVMFFLIWTLPVFAQHVPSDERGSSSYRRTTDIAGNLVRTTIWNNGTTGRTKPGDGIPYEWPKNTGKHYLAQTGLMIGAEVMLENGTIRPITAVHSRSSNTGESWQMEPIKEYCNPNSDDIALTTLAASGEDRKTWPDTWPDKMGDEEDPGWTGSWNGYFGKNQFKADYELYYKISDDTYDRYEYYPDTTDLTRRGLGLLVDVRVLQWSQILVNDVVFVLYDIKNDGTKDLDKAAVTLFVFDLVGGDGDNMDDHSDFDLLNDVAWCTDSPPNQGNTAFGDDPVGVAATSFLETPGNAIDGIDNDGDGEENSPIVTETMIFDEDATNQIDDNQNGLIDENQTHIAFGAQVGVGYRDHIDNDGDGESDSPTITSEMIAGETVDNGKDDNSNGLYDEDNSDVGSGYRDWIDNNGNGEANSPVITQAMIDAAAGSGGRYTAGNGITLYNVGAEDLGKRYADGKDNDGNNAVDEFIDEGIDEMIDESRENFIDDDGDWDLFNDDVGLDGDILTVDKGQSDGAPTSGAGTDLPGEPNIDKTDVSESDQLGVTNVQYQPAGDFHTEQDDNTWRRWMTPGKFWDPTVDYTGEFDLFVSSGFFPLKAGQRERVSMAVNLGQDSDDAMRNRNMSQKTYDLDYTFATAPLIPTLTAIPGNNKVTLYWDSKSELSFDKFMSDIGAEGYDFEGYRIYKATDPAFEDAYSITDADGNYTYYRPVAQFDLANGIKGLDSLSINGAHFDMGDDTGLRHSWVDTDVINGQAYYYAVTAYDREAAWAEIPPSETPIPITVETTGEVKMGSNVARVVPNAVSAGYVAPQLMNLEKPIIGNTTGIITYDIVDARIIPDNHTYRITFRDTLIEGKELTDTDTLTTLDFSLFDVTYEGQGGVDTLIWQCKKLKSSDEVPMTDGFRLILENEDEIAINQSLSKWNDDDVFPLSLIPFQAGFWIGFPNPADYRITFGDVGMDTSVYLYIRRGVELQPRPVNFTVYNTTDSANVAFAFWETDGNDGVFSASYLETDVIVFMEKNAVVDLAPSWRFKVVYDTLHRNPQSGDVADLFVTKPFLSNVIFEFTTDSAKIDVKQAANDLDRIKVVPNPYVAAAIWEPRNFFTTGRGPRSIHFNHLPKDCTIRIFTVNGELVDTIDHHSLMDNGSAEWDVLTRDNLTLAYGVYIFHVDAPGIGEKIGKFAIIK